MSRRDSGVILILLAWTALFFFFVLANDDLPHAATDTTRYCAPALAFLRNALLDGQFPLWNPYQLAGGPFLALHSPGATYPLLVVFALLPAHVAVTVHSVLHVFLTGLLTYAFARSAGVARVGSLASSLTYVGSVHIFNAAHGNTAYFSTLAWLPGVFWGLRQVVLRPTALRGVLFAAAVAMCFLGG